MSAVSIASVRGRLSGRRWPRIVAMALLVAVLLAIVAAALAPMAHADDNSKDLSFYKLGSSVSKYFGDSTAPGSKGLGDGWATNVTNSSSNAGSVAGYADPSFFSNPLKWLSSQTSNSSQSMDYRSLAPYPGVRSYAYFGAANADLGLDSMNAGIGGAVLQGIAGGIMFLAYLLASGVSIVMWVVVKLLELINPFGWFKAALGSHVSGALASASLPGPLKGLSNWIGTWYHFLVTMSWTVLVPIFLGILVAGLLLGRANRGRKVRNFVVRILAIGLALPIIGGVYTSILDQFDSGLTDAQTGPTKVVLSNYVDFQKWMANDRLAVPKKAVIEWNATTGKATDKAQMSARNTALAINLQSDTSYKNSGVSPLDPTDSAQSAWSQGNPDTSTTKATTASTFSATTSLLWRYMHTGSVSSADFETGAKTAISTSKASSVDKWFTDGGLDNSDADGYWSKGRVNPLLTVKAGSGLQSATKGSTTSFSTANVAATSGGAHCNYAVSDHNGQPYACNLAPLAAYNYLSTKFSSDHMDVYSGNKAPSAFSSNAHASVSQVGSGASGFLYWANGVVVLGSIAVLGLTYALGMLYAAVKRGFAAVAAIPFATVGSLTGIAKFLSYSIAMICELLVTMFLYQFVSQFIIGIPQLIEQPFASYASAHGNWGVVLVPLMTILSIALIVWITRALMGARDTIMRAVDEGVTNIVNRIAGLEGANAVAPGASLAGAGALGAAAGAGGAKAGELASGPWPDGDDKDDSGSGSGSGSGGPSDKGSGSGSGVSSGGLTPADAAGQAGDGQSGEEGSQESEESADGVRGHGGMDAGTEVADSQSLADTQGDDDRQIAEAAAARGGTYDPADPQRASVAPPAAARKGSGTGGPKSDANTGSNSSMGKAVAKGATTGAVKGAKGGPAGAVSGAAAGAAAGGAGQRAKDHARTSDRPNGSAGGTSKQTGGSGRGVRRTGGTPKQAGSTSTQAGGLGRKVQKAGGAARSAAAVGRRAVTGTGQGHQSLSKDVGTKGAAAFQKGAGRVKAVASTAADRRAVASGTKDATQVASSTNYGTKFAAGVVGAAGAVARTTARHAAQATARGGEKAGAWTGRKAWNLANSGAYGVPGTGRNETGDEKPKDGED